MSLGGSSSVLRCAAAILLSSLGSFAPGQAPPHLSITPSAARTLLPGEITLLSSMCQPADAYCLSKTKGPFAYSPIVTAGPDGDIYFVDTQARFVARVSPDGKSHILAGKVGVTNYTGSAPPLSQRAIDLTLATPTGIVVDLAGDIYLADAYEAGGAGSLIEIDPMGSATRITASSVSAAPYKDGALASTQLVSPDALAIDTAGNVYFHDSTNCTVREYVAATKVLRTVAGIPGSCSNNVKIGKAFRATTVSLPSHAALAVNQYGTVYLADKSFGIASVTTDGIIHGLAQASVQISAGFLGGGSGSVGQVQNGLAVDAAGNLYFSSANNTFANGQQPPLTLLELAVGVNGNPSQVLVLTGGTGYFTSEGLASTSLRSGFNGTSLALDSFGRLVGTFLDSGGIQYLDRTGSLNFPIAFGPQGPSSPEQFITFTNTGGSTLTGVAVGGATYVSGLAINPPGGSDFSIDQGNGTCLQFGAGSLVLAPGESCTLGVLYTWGNSFTSGGALTFFSNDPLGPSTVVLTGKLPGAPLSITTLSAVSSSSVDGSFTLTANTPAHNGGYDLLGFTDATTGARVQPNPFVAPTFLTGPAVFNITGLKPGHYFAQVENTGSSGYANSYSPLLSLVVAPNGIDYTSYASVNYHFPYAAATAQLLNFAQQRATDPSYVLAEDALSGNLNAAVTLTDMNGVPLDVTSPAILPAGLYKVAPTSTSTGYRATLHPATINIDKADLTLSLGRTSASFGQLLTTGSADASHFAYAPATITGAQAVLQGELTNGGIVLTPVLSGTPFDPSNTYLSPGVYPLTMAVSGPSASNYSLTLHPGSLVVRPADMTVNGAGGKFPSNTNVSYVQLLGTAYVAPNTTLFGTDPTVEVHLILSKAGNYVSSLAPGQTISFPTVGNYLITPVLTGWGASNYSFTSHPGTITVYPGNGAGVPN